MAKRGKLINPNSTGGKFLIVAIAFAVIGGAYAAYQSFAGSPPVASQEAESMLLAQSQDPSVTPAAAVVNDSSASGGKAMQFTKNGELYQTVTTAKKVNQVKVYVRDSSTLPPVTGAAKKKGPCTVPSLVQVYVDGKSVTHQFKITNQKWLVRGQMTGRAIPAGQHSVQVFYQHDPTDGTCVPQLMLDKVDFFFKPPPPPSPVDQLAADPVYLNPSVDTPYTVCGDPTTCPGGDLTAPGDAVYLPGDTIYPDATKDSCHPGNYCAQ